MKKFAALMLLTLALVVTFGSAMAEDVYFFTCEQVEEAFEERFGYWVDVTQHKGLDDDPEGCYFRIPNSKCMEVSYLAVDGFSSDGEIWYVDAQKLNAFFERHEGHLKLYAWENLEEPFYYSLEEVDDFLMEGFEVPIDLKTKTHDGDFEIFVEGEGDTEFSVEFGSLWRKEVAEGQYRYHQAVVTELYQQWLNATAGTN